MDIWCKSCGHTESLPRALKNDEGCPVCNAGVYKRRGKQPTPRTHAGALFKSLLSLRGILFIGFVTVLASLPDWRSSWFAAVMLTFGALKLAMKAMKVNREGIEFPELSPEELFDASAILPSLVFSLFFVLGPLLLITYSQTGSIFGESAQSSTSYDSAPAQRNHQGDPLTTADLPPGFLADDDDEPSDSALAAAQAAADRETKRVRTEDDVDDDPPVKSKSKSSSMNGKQKIALGVALFLLAFAPMALVMFLRTGTTFALFFVPQGIQAILGDIRGYLALCAFVWPALIGNVLLNAIANALPFFMEPIAEAPRAVLVLLTWGFCGLYVRSRAREFDIPVDDDDWVLHERKLAPSPASTGAPSPVARQRPTSVGLGPDDDDLPPVVPGQLL